MPDYYRCHDKSDFQADTQPVDPGLPGCMQDLALYSRPPEISNPSWTGMLEQMPN